MKRAKGLFEEHLVSKEVKTNGLREINHEIKRPKGGRAVISKKRKQLPRPEALRDGKKKRDRSSALISTFGDDARLSSGGRI